MSIRELLYRLTKPAAPRPVLAPSAQRGRPQLEVLESRMAPSDTLGAFTVLPVSDPSVGMVVASQPTS